MFSAKTFAIGASILGLVSAVPVPAENPWNSWSSGPSSATGAPAPAAPSGSSGSSADASGIISGNPFSFPLPNGFPNLSADQLNAVNQQAHGTQPNGGAPTLGKDDLLSIQLIAFNEIFEVAFFTDLLYNVTNNVAGFTISDATTRTNVINALIAIQAQEELHAVNANAILSANNVAPIQPCKYQFPTTTLTDALNLAATFTDVVLGTLQDVQFHLASNGAAAVVPIIGSVIGNEGEQTGFFRYQTGKIPSSKPFLTRSSREFAFSALNQNFVVSGSCPNSNTINLPVFTPLTVVTSPISATTQDITFSVPVSGSSLPAGVSLVLINGQNTPIVEAVQDAKVSNGVATFQARFPFDAQVLDGLTIAALTSTGTGLTSAEDVAKVTIAGPGLIEVN